MKYYSTALIAGGHLLLSGFYEKDIPDLKQEAEKFGLTALDRDNRESWACLLLQKK